MQTEADLVGLCLALIGDVSKLSPAERRLVNARQETLVEPFDIEAVRAEIEAAHGGAKGDRSRSAAHGERRARAHT